MSTDFNKVLAPSETIVWQSKPQFLPYVLSAVPFLIIGSFFIAITVAMPLGDWYMQPYFWVPVIIGPGFFLYTLINYFFVAYAITDKRVLIQNGVIGRDYVGIEHDKITSTSVKVGLIDKIFGRNSGSILILHPGSGRTKNGAPIPNALASITDPYAVYQLLNKTSHDIRTDIQYPNAMRPEVNPGYGTEYKQ